MAQTIVTQEGAFDLGAKTAINNNFSQLFSGRLDLTPRTASVTLTSEDSGVVNALNVATGMTVTLPAATGSGNTYMFAVTTTVTSNSYIIKVASSSDIFGGTATMGSAGGSPTSVGTAADSDTITMNGTTTAGRAGTWIGIRDIASGLFQVYMYGVASGVASTPFSATV